MRNTRNEHLWSEIASIADVEQTSWQARSAPGGDIGEWTSALFHFRTSRSLPIHDDRFDDGGRLLRYQSVAGIRDNDDFNGAYLGHAPFGSQSFAAVSQG
jgi:hypothetical protein